MGRVARVILILLASLIPVVLFCGVNVLVMEFLRCGPPRFRQAVISGTTVAMCVAVLVVYRRGFVRTNPTAVRLTLAASAVAGLVLPVLSVPAWYRGITGAWQLKESIMLRDFIRQKRADLHDGLPQTSAIRLVTDQSWNGRDLFTDYCSCQQASDVRFGDVTLQMHWDGKISRDQLVQAAAAVAPETPGWERVGGYVFCSDVQTLSKGWGSDVILAYSLQRRMTGVSPMQVVGGDERVHPIREASDIEWIERAIDRARTSGLAVPPDDVAEHARRLLGL